MNGVEIHDEDPNGWLAFDLKHILDCLRSEVVLRTWRIEGIECSGEAARELEEIDDLNTTNRREQTN